MRSLCPVKISLKKSRRNKDFLRESKAKRIHYEQTCNTKIVKRGSLGSRNMVTDRKWDLHKEI